METEQARERKRRELYKRRLQARRKTVFRQRCFIAIAILTIFIGLVILLVIKIMNLFLPQAVSIGHIGESQVVQEIKTEKPVITEDFLSINEHSRPGDTIETVNNIFVHYTANPGTSAAQNKSYFESLAETGVTSASAHFIIGYEGEIIQCIPLDEIGYAVQTRNYDSISIECCYLDESGVFTEETYTSLVQLTNWLLEKYNLGRDDVLRHYDQNGKLCPVYYVENEEAWEEFKQDLDFV
ncbi:MAG: peptidoglycan recognition family protein [Eubacteriales bacterium]